MLSMPAAIPSSICPARMELEMFTMDCSPEEQSRLTVEMGTSTGIPAAIAAARDTYKGDGGWHVPEETS